MDISEDMSNLEEWEELRQMARETLIYRINEEGKLHETAV